MSKTFVAAAVLSVAILSGFPAAADAKGFSLTLTPKGDAAKVVGTGLSVYGTVQQLRNRAKTSQRGESNAAGIGQAGVGNRAVVVQRGNNNTGTVSQSGNYNAYGLFQFGRGNHSNVVQEGNGRVGITIQGRW